MNREQKRELVCQLYNEGKTMREISKQAHMSFSDIGSIIKKINQVIEPKNGDLTPESQVLALFKEGKDPLEVTISTKLSSLEVEKIFKQFLKLKGLHCLPHLYERIKPDISNLIKIYEVVKKYNLTEQDMFNIIEYSDEFNYLKDEIAEEKWQLSCLLKEKNGVQASLLTLKNEYIELADQVDGINNISIRKQTQIQNLNDEIKKLEDLISGLKLNDEYCKFERFNRENLDLMLKDRRWILALAVDAVIQLIKKDELYKEMLINNRIAKINREKFLDFCEPMFDNLLRQLIDMSPHLYTNESVDIITKSDSNTSIMSDECKEI